MRKIICILFLCPLLAFAQFDASMFRTDNQKLIELAVTDAFCIVEQAYQLEDTVTHQRFGRFGNENFGKSRTLGIRMGTNVVFCKNILRPWEQDANFQRYRLTHLPVPSRFEIKNFNDSIIDRKFNLARESPSICEVSSIYSMINDSVSGRIGFYPKQSNRLENGWFVWVTGDSIQSIQFGELPTLSIYTRDVDFSKTEAPILVDAPLVDKSIWGGVFIIPEQSKIGQLNFYVYGIISKSEDDKWVLEPFRKLSNGSNQGHSKDELTPLNVENLTKKKRK